MSHFGDLLAGNVSAPPVAPPPVEDPVVTPPPVVPDIATPTPPEPAVVFTEDLPDLPTVPDPTPTYADLSGKSKYELEQIGRTIGIELDRRLSHDKLVTELLQAFANQ